MTGTIGYSAAMARLFSTLVLLLATLCAVPAAAQQNGFDLAGPELAITVRRGDVTLPLGQVPSLRPGDRLTARAALPADQSARYLLVVAFLRGATNPPPKSWFFRAETWSRKRATLDVAVPEGAEQALVFMAPEAGGGFDAVRGAVRGRPGIFVRAAQDLQQASLDRARLDAFVAAVARIGETAPERLASVAPVLADSLGVRLNADCLTRQRALQAACLMQDRGGQVLQAQRGSTLTETLTGTPVDLAYRVAATPEGGGGFYSPYIALARDLARLFGAFRTAQYQYLPALAVGGGERLTLWLNAAPSFQNPRSVLVAPLPPIGTALPPLWRSTAPGPLCLAAPRLVLPLGDAALLHATGYARDLSLRVTTDGGAVTDLPLVADIDAGGLRLGNDAPVVRGTVREAVVRGRWGFDGFSGPRVAVQADGGDWAPQPDDAVIVGRDSPLVLRGGAAACIAGMTLATGDDRRPLAWEATAPDTVRVTLPLAKVRPGALTLAIDRHGVGTGQQVALTARAEASRLDRFAIHAGDRDGVLGGQRLDQVQAVDFAGQRFTGGALTRAGDGDRLVLTGERAVAAGAGGDARVTLRDGRTAGVAVTVGPARPAVTVLQRAATLPPAAVLPIRLPDDLVPAQGTLRFSLRVAGGIEAGDAIELASEAGGARLTFASGAVQRVGGDIGVAAIVPAEALGAQANGPLRVRVLRGEVAGDWQPLARIVRLPAIGGVACPATGDCSVSGSDLHRIAAIGGVTVPPGFVGSSIAVPRFTGTRLPLRLQDAPDVTVEVELPAPPTEP
ncbi:hypothetical protein [Sphingomonas sp. VNH70]|uniref:hypothetical protein n=1 Tax=Sphingomonas silueang TaxID=3156617 RepID=UPI0032B5E061